MCVCVEYSKEWKIEKEMKFLRFIRLIEVCVNYEEEIEK